MALPTIVRILIFLLGLAIVVGTVGAAIRAFVLPRSSPDGLTRVVFVGLRHVFNVLLYRAHSYLERDQIMAFYAPVALLTIVPTWLGLVLIGYMGMYWALGTPSWYEAFRISGSSVLTLGFAMADDTPRSVLALTEATTGLILVALLISYLPTIYSAFARREAMVTMLEVRAGSPPSAIELIQRYFRIRGLDQLGGLWITWEVWFTDVEESHTSLGVLTFFRSPQPGRSWVTAAGAVLDAAALASSTLDIPHDPQADLCVRAGYLALRHVADFFRIPYNPDPHFPDEPISISRAEYDAACDLLARDGVPLKPDRDQSWRDFAGWRVNYDSVLLKMASLTMAPWAPWSSDRAPKFRMPSIF